MLGEVPASLERERAITDPVEDECGYPHGIQDGTYVDLAVHLRQGTDSSRTGTQPEVARPVRPEAFVIDPAWGPHVEPDRPAPAFRDLIEECLQRVAGVAPRIVACDEAACVAAEQDDRGRADRIRRPEQHAHRSALRDAEQRRPFRADGIADREHVAHAYFERRQGGHGDTVGHAGSTLVEEDEA